MDTICEPSTPVKGAADARTCAPDDEIGRFELADAIDRGKVPIRDRLLWDLDDIKVLTGISRRTLERCRASGAFPTPDIKIGKRPRWKPETIRRWIDAGGPATKAGGSKR